MSALETMVRAASSKPRGGRCCLVGSNFSAPQGVGHRITEGGVSLILPRGRPLTDVEAKKLAWGLLADLAPEETQPAPEVVTYREAQRLLLMEAMRSGALTINALAAKCGLHRRVTERLLRNLLNDGRAQRLRDNHAVLFGLTAYARNGGTEA